MANDNEKPLWEVTSTDGENRAKIALTVGSTKDVDIERDKEIQFVPGGNLRPATKEEIADQMNAITASFGRTNDHLRQIADAVKDGELTVAQPEKRSFLKDVTKGFAGTLVSVAKTVWHVPAAQGYLATLVVRLGVPAGAVAIISAIVDAVLN